WTGAAGTGAIAPGAASAAALRVARNQSHGGGPGRSGLGRRWRTRRHVVLPFDPGLAKISETVVCEERVEEEDGRAPSAAYEGCGRENRDAKSASRYGWVTLTFPITIPALDFFQETKSKAKSRSKAKAADR